MEIWKDIEGFEQYYQISNLGRVKAKDRIISRKKNGSYLRKEMILNHSKSTTYLIAHLITPNKKTAISVHRLVATHFIKNEKNKPTVNHINGKKHDNRAENLEWASYSENRIHAYKTGIQKATIGQINGMSKLKDSDVFEIKYNLKSLKVSELSKMFSISESAIKRIIKNKSWKHV